MKQEKSKKTKDARSYALEILTRIERGEAYSNVLLAHAAKDPLLPKEQFPFLEKLVKGTLEQKIFLENSLDKHLPRGLGSLPPVLQQMLKLAAYQVLFINNIPTQVSVDVMVELCKKSKFSGFSKLINAVLRKLSQSAQSPQVVAVDDNSPSSLSAKYSHPLWLVELYQKILGEGEVSQLCEINNRPWPVCFRLNSLRADRAALARSLETQAVSTTATAYSNDCLIAKQLPPRLRIEELSAIVDGLCLVQDEASALVPLLLDPQPGEFVVDLCSAPGGKTTHIAALMQNKGRILALEINSKKIRYVNENCQRLGVSIVETLQADSSTLELPEKADRVLLDAPCSGLGVLGKRADIRWSKSIEQIEALLPLQQKLLESAYKMLRPGGRLVYSTCTITREENEDAIDKFLASHPQMRLLPPPASMAADLFSERGFLRTWPHKHKMAGGFAAVMERVA